MDSEFKRAMSPSLGLLVIAALTPDEHQVEIADENIGRIRFDDWPDLVGITANVDTSSRAYDIASRYRARGIPVILGGIHPSANPEEAARHADAVCIGEAEPVWDEILSDLQNGGLRPYYQGDGATDLAVTPIPEWEKIDPSRYLYTNIVVTSRGCPFRCRFCYNSCDYVKTGIRNRPIDNVLGEIEQLGTRQVLFIDDNFIGNLPWTKALLKRMKPLGLRWHAAVSANLVHHPDLLDEMAASGCKSLFIGFESVNQSSLREGNKAQNQVEGYSRLIREIHERGIMVNASLVFGFDSDGPSVFDDTLDWLISNKIETMTAHILTPYPGTGLHSDLLAEGRITETDLSKYNTSNVVFRPKGMTAGELRQGYLSMYDRFYSLKNILRRMPDDSRRMPYLLFNLGYRRSGALSSVLAKAGLMNSFGRLVRRLSYGIG